MYMAPITRAETELQLGPSRPLLRRAIGVPVLALAALVAVPWLVGNALVAGVVLAGRFGVQAVDYAGQVALGR